MMKIIFLLSKLVRSVHDVTKISTDDFVVFKKQRVCDIKEVNSDCKFSLQSGGWQVFRVIRKDNKMYEQLIKMCWQVFPPNISCNDREGNKLLFYYTNFEL